MKPQIIVLALLTTVGPQTLPQTPQTFEELSTMAKRAYHEWLEVMPSNRILWGADALNAETIYAYTEVTRRCLAEVLAGQVAALPVDLCVLTGDYRFEVYGQCGAVYPRMRRVLSAVRARRRSSSLKLRGAK